MFTDLLIAYLLFSPLGFVKTKPIEIDRAHPPSSTD
jgi:hypothetical protein